MRSNEGLQPISSVAPRVSREARLQRLKPAPTRTVRAVVSNVGTPEAGLQSQGFQIYFSGNKCSFLFGLREIVRKRTNWIGGGLVVLQ